MEGAFQKCRQNWQADFARILDAITRGRFAPSRDLPRSFPSGELVGWEMPSGVIADEVWRKMPPSFKAKGAPKNTQDTATAPQEDGAPESPSTNDSQ
jgi:hypothetical protein